MPGFIGNWHKEQLLKHAAGLAEFTPPATLDLHFGSTSYDADGAGTNVPGSAAVSVDNDDGTWSWSGGRVVSASPITTGNRASGGDVVTVAFKATMPGAPTQVLYYGDLEDPVEWAQGQALTVPSGSFTIDLQTA